MPLFHIFIDISFHAIIDGFSHALSRFSLSPAFDASFDAAAALLASSSIYSPLSAPFSPPPIRRRCFFADISLSLMLIAADAIFDYFQLR
jgi:hypothetical protein